MIRRSERGPRADTDGGKDPSIGSSAPPHEMESHLISSETTTESQSTDSSDELTEPVIAEMSPPVSGSPGVEMGVSGNAIPVPEVEPEDPSEVNNTYIPPVATPLVPRLFIRPQIRIVTLHSINRGPCRSRLPCQRLAANPNGVAPTTMGTLFNA